jgi:cyclophilin family peptidyl-prolyl cis-trans isomerase
LIEGGYLVTNAHVVWPFDEVRVVFPDGSEHLEAPVVGSDLMGDLAVIGPLETTADPLALVDGENLVIGSELFLIGYPAEQERFPQPSVTRGILSRLRQWEPIKMTYLQTDATIAGGQSGGVLVSKKADVIGISGFSFSEAGFGLVASAADVKVRVEGLIAGDDVDGLGDRGVSMRGGRLEHDFTLQGSWDVRTYVINEAAGTTVDIQVESGADGIFSLVDMAGNLVLFADDEFAGVEYGLAVIEVGGPHFLDIGQLSDAPGSFRVTSDRSLAPYVDPDDGAIVTAGRTAAGSIDFPGDFDYFEIDLEEGDVIDVALDSMNIDPLLQLSPIEITDDLIVDDDDSGGGIFGLNAQLACRASHNGKYLIFVLDSNGVGVGGYFLTVSEAQSGAVPAPAPGPAPTATPVPADSRQDERTGQQYARPPSMSIDPSTSYTATIRTNHGEIVLELFAAQASRTVNNFVFLAREGFYDGTIFHRVIEGFMIQGGDPTGTGAGGPGYAFGDEFLPQLVFDRPGILAMANAGPDTNGSQFFITVVPTPHLNGAHTIFGQVASGQGVVDSISSLPTGAGDRPLEDVVIESVLIEN